MTLSPRIAPLPATMPPERRTVLPFDPDAITPRAREIARAMYRRWAARREAEMRKQANGMDE